LSRTHSANSSRAVLCFGVTLAPVNPGGSRSLHAPSACSNTALFVFTDEPLAIASIVSSPDASGSGNALTPLARMHSANFTAFSRVALPSPPVLLRVPPHPALTTTTTASMASAAGGRSALLIAAPLIASVSVRAFGGELLVPSVVAVNPGQQPD